MLGIFNCILKGYKSILSHFHPFPDNDNVILYARQLNCKILKESYFTFRMNFGTTIFCLWADVIYNKLYKLAVVSKNNKQFYV